MCVCECVCCWRSGGGSTPSRDEVARTEDRVAPSPPPHDDDVTGRETLSFLDEVGLLDPVSYPLALKAFAKSICRNDVLNFGRLHFFFPDSRLALDLNTDKALRPVVNEDTLTPWSCCVCGAAHGVGGGGWPITRGEEESYRHARAAGRRARDL